MTYQSINGESSSDSIAKLACLNFPDLSSKRFLDLGCNEGFFCGAALAGGASQAVGVDYDENSIRNAKKHFPVAQFIHSDWSTFLSSNPEKFDTILFASAIHYAADQEGILKQVLDTLNENGILILECGIGSSDERNAEFVTRDRWDGAKVYFTRSHLDKILGQHGFQAFVSYPSVKQAGDEIDRHVFHIRRRKVTYLFNFDHPGSGKTYMGSMLSASAEQRSLDELAKVMIEESKYAPLSEGISQNVALFWERTVELSMHDLAAQRIFDFISATASDLTYVEGWIPDQIVDILMRLLSHHDCVGFTVSRTAGILPVKSNSSAKGMRIGQQAWFGVTMEKSALDSLQIYKVGELNFLVAIGWQDKQICFDEFVLLDKGWTTKGNLLHRPDRGDVYGFGMPFVVSFEVPDRLVSQLRERAFPEIFVMGNNRIAHRIRMESHSLSVNFS